MNLRLPGGIEVIDADRKLLRFMESEHAIYDGVEIKQDSTLSILDILLSVAMNSRLDTADKIRSVWEGKAPVEEALAAVPNDVALEDEDVPWQPMELLFDRFCRVKFVGAAVATKILHKKRPRLIPVFDSVVSECIRGFNTLPSPANPSTGALMIHGIRFFRSLLMESLDQIKELLSLPELNRFQVTPVRVLEVLLWIENENSGYYQSCFECRCERVMPIIYGQPTRRQERLAQQGKILLDRRERDPGYPKWRCCKCGTKWTSPFAQTESATALVQDADHQVQEEGLFYFYENWVAKGHTAVIHRATCGHCNQGRGRTGKVRTANGAWSSSYISLEDARMAAEAKGADVTRCSFCLRTV